MASIPFLIGAHRNLREDAPQQAATPVPVAPDAPPSPTPPQQQQIAGINWSAFETKLKSLISQPDSDSQAVMKLIADMVTAAPVGSSDRQQMIDLIKAFQTNETMMTKVPQLQRISLQEAPPPTTGQAVSQPQTQAATAPTQTEPAEMKRSEIDRIFTQTAQFLAHQKVTNPDLFRQQPQPQQQVTQGNRRQTNRQGIGQQNLNTYANSNITQQNIQRAAKQISSSNVKLWVDPINAKLAELSKTGTVTVKTLINQIKKDFSSRPPDQRFDAMPEEVTNMLIAAARFG